MIWGLEVRKPTSSARAKQKKGFPYPLPARVFKTARLLGLPAAALFSLSDVSVKNQSLFSGRPEAEKDYRRYFLIQNVRARRGLSQPTNQNCTAVPNW